MASSRVLIIEDDQDLLYLLHTHLRKLGCQVSLAASGEQGLALAFADPPDLAIVDIVLPGIDGREVVRRLRADPRTSGCRIAVSSVLDPDDLRDLEPDALLTKPFQRDVREVLERLATVLGSPYQRED